MSLTRTKSIEQSIADTEEPEHRLKKNLGAIDLVVFGIGVTIGAGIFVLTGQEAAASAGPAIALSFVVAGLACGLAALCYAEFASTVPVAGSAYTFSYATFGEFTAWIIGWDLALEFTIGSAALCVGFSDYLVNLLDGTPFAVPASLQSAESGIINLPAVLLALAVMTVLIVGIKLSSRINEIVVAIKLTVVLLVIVAGIGYIDTANYSPFIPPAEAPPPAEGGFAHVPLITTLLGLEPAVYGLAGVFAAAAVVFFAFIGFDVVATTAEETRNPQRNMPIGILGSLAIVTVLYMAVSLVITGMQNFRDIDPEDGAPLATAFDAVGLEWMANVIAVGACIGLTMVAMILMLGQSRVAFAMARDGLLPRAISRVHPRFGTPYIITGITGVTVAVIAGFVELGTLVDMVSIGTLFAFLLVSLGVLVLRRARPDLPRGFRVPAAPFVAVGAVLICLWLMLNLVGETWIRFVVWMAIGLLVYFFYGRSHSRLGQRQRESAGGGPSPT